MYEFHPYFTNDGSVGLYSPNDDDIYHSTYGALSEAYQKFIEPSHIEEFLKNNTEVKVLDICFGIGYNTKSFLNTFLKILNSSPGKFSQNFSFLHKSIAAIDTDNISTGEESKKSVKEAKNTINVKIEQNLSLQKKYKIKIDLIDTDKTLLNLSPLIAIKKPHGNYKLSKNLPKKIFDLNTSTTKTKYKLQKEVLIILYKKLLENNLSRLDSKNLNEVLSKKENLPFFDKFMLNLIKSEEKRPYKYNKRIEISAFLHNIYYQYLSKSYKNTEKLLKNHQIDINPYINDARIAIKELDEKYNFIFLDAFTPSKCPCLWSLAFFKELYKRLEDNGSIVTYSNSVAVRSAFIQAGFFVGKIKAGEKFMGTIAVKNNGLVEHELSNYDLGLINSRAGICYKDIDLNLANDTIIKNRVLEVETSDRISSSQFIKGYKNGKL